MTNKNITSPTAALIFQAWEREGRSERPRTYLGASIIGDPCDRKLWLYFRGVCRDQFDGRLFRLFDRGRREEAVFCSDLRRIGCEVKEFDDNGNQFAVSDFGGHFGGHLDGVVRGLPEAPTAWHVVEFKTHSDTSFKKLCREGVKTAKPQHYDQMTVYMGKTGIDRAFYMAVNKDNDDLWCERVAFDTAHYDLVMTRAKHIIDTCEPDRCANRPDDFRCKGCCCHEICWHEHNTLVAPSLPTNCLTCCHATADTEHDGETWTCRLGHACSSANEDCKDYLVLPIFVNGAIVEGDQGSITYEKDGHQFVIGDSGLSVAEAKRIGVGELAIAKTVKQLYPYATIVGSSKLLVKYSDTAKYEIYFDGTREAFNQWLAQNPICDWTKPIAQDAAGGKQYFEYAPSTLLIIDSKTARVVAEHPPF